MDSKNQIKDLPDPVRTNYSEEERRYRQWRLLVIFIQFVTFYACLHKLFIPITLKFTSLSETPYADIQPSLVLALFFSLLTSNSKSNNARISFLAGVLIVFGVSEIYQTSIHRVSGWFAFSRLLSAVPLAVASGYAMSRRSFQGKVRHAWLGATLFLAVFVIREWHFSERTPVPSLNQTAIPHFSPAVHPNLLCGAQDLRVSTVTGNPLERKVKIADCGFSPSTVLTGEEPIEFENTTDRAVNLHLLVFDGEKKKTAWNLLVPPHGRLLGTKIVLTPNQIGLLYSDNFPGLGLVAIRPISLTKNWVLTRKPLHAEAAP